MRLVSQAGWAGKRVGRLRAAGEIEIHDAPLGISDAQFNRSAILHLILRSLFVRGRSLPPTPSILPANLPTPGVGQTPCSINDYYSIVDYTTILARVERSISSLSNHALSIVCSLITFHRSINASTVIRVLFISLSLSISTA